MWEEIVKVVLGTLESEGAKAVLKELEQIAADWAEPLITKEVARLLLKGVDAVVVAGVKTLADTDALSLTEKYVEHVDGQLAALAEALGHYIPLQIAVELAKKAHGDNSPEANAARQARRAGIDTVRTDVGAVFAELFGEHVSGA